MELDTAIEGLLKHREVLTKVWNNPNRLSDEATKIATYNSYLGDSIGELTYEYETKRARIYLQHSERTSATAAENTAKAETAELKAKIRKLELMHKDAWSLVSMVQTRLKQLDKEMNNGRN
jgi:hypothetical protein